MSPEDRGLIRQWIEKAESDFLAADYLLSLGEDSTIEAVCFHAQQCVEKYVKAVLVLHGIPFPKTHDIADVVARLPDPDATGIGPEEQERLTDYATVTRYPGDYDPIMLEEARIAVQLARGVRNRMRELLPNECLES